MKNLNFLILILILFIPLGSISAQSKTRALRPQNAKIKVKTFVYGKSRTYYPLLKEEPSIITVRGPGNLRVITRAQFKSESDQTLDYTISCRVDGVKMGDVKFEHVKKSKNTVFKNTSLGVPGDGKDMILEFDRGEHTIELSCMYDFPVIAARYLFTRTKGKKIKWISLSPLFPNEPIDLLTEETVTNYYRFSADKPLRVEIIGPTTLRVLNRLENNYKMKGRINYRLQVKEDGKIKNTYLLNSVRSEVTTYKNDMTKLPGKAKEIVIIVPEGKHNYEILPLDKDKNTVLGRLQFPKKDVKLEE
jgi:hypothetical protein